MIIPAMPRETQIAITPISLAASSFDEDGVGVIIVAVETRLMAER